MKIEKRIYNKLIKTANILLIIGIIVHVLTVAVYFGSIIFQNIFISKSEFIFPYIHAIEFVVCFCAFILFTIFILKKNVMSNKSIGLELTGLVTIVFLNTIFSRIMNIIELYTIHIHQPNYISEYIDLINYLYKTMFLLPYAILMFYIAVTIKMILTKLNPIEIDLD